MCSPPGENSVTVLRDPSVRRHSSVVSSPLMLVTCMTGVPNAASGTGTSAPSPTLTSHSPSAHAESRVPSAGEAEEGVGEAEAEALGVAGGLDGRGLGEDTGVDAERRDGGSEGDAVPDDVEHPTSVTSAPTVSAA